MEWIDGASQASMHSRSHSMSETCVGRVQVRVVTFYTLVFGAQAIRVVAGVSFLIQ